MYSTRDPWGFEKSPVEAAKYAITLDLCGPGPFARALEIGCSEGEFTEQLAARCRILVAADISPTAVERTRRRLAGVHGVTVRTMTMPHEYPEGAFDLIVASDVLYYLRPADVGVAARTIVDSLAPGGRFIAVHFARSVVAGTSGDLVHELLAAAITEPPVHHELRDIGEGRPYRLDVWARSR